MAQEEPSKADLMSLGLNQASQHVPCKMCEITGIETPTLSVEVEQLEFTEPILTGQKSFQSNVEKRQPV